jgi:hypothetical protein
MRFQFHLSAGLEIMESFWEERGLQRTREPVLFGGYTRGSVRHTAYLEWERSHAKCADVRLGLVADKPKAVFPRMKASEHRLLVKDLRVFFNMLRQLPERAVSGIAAEYGIPWHHDLQKLFKPRAPDFVRVTKVETEIRSKDNKKIAMRLEYRREHDGSCLAVVKPVGTLELMRLDRFFDAAYRAGCMFAQSVEGSPPDE